MRIVYGANTQGQGHLSKAAVLVPALESLGHEVFVVTSGPTPDAHYRFRQHLHFEGLPYILRNGQADYAATAQGWLTRLPAYGHALWSARRLLHAWQPGLILSDFEPTVTSPLLGSACEVVAMSRQVALCDPQVSLPAGWEWERRWARTTIRLFVGAADRRLGFQYSPASFRALPPVLRPELFDLRPEEGEHALVYCHEDQLETLMAFARRSGWPVRAYGLPGVPRGDYGPVRVCPSSRHQMLEDLRTARAVLCNSGFTTPIESIVLGKPTVVVPLRQQWEQMVNAYQLDELELATMSADFEPERLLEAPPPCAAAVGDWLRHSPIEILQRIDPRLVPAEVRVAA